MLTQKIVKFKTFDLFLFSEILHLIFLDHGGPQVTETAESESTDKRELLYSLFYYVHFFLLIFKEIKTFSWTPKSVTCMIWILMGKPSW